MIRIKLVENEQKIEYPEVLGATLLSVEEYEKYRNNIPLIASVSDWWWLRTAGNSSEYTCLVDDNGYVYYDYYTVVSNPGGGIRPALILNPKSSNLKVFNKFNFGKYMFTIISSNLALCIDIIGEGYFRKDQNSEDANIYIKSDVKKVVDDWFIKTLCKSPDCWGENNIDIVIDNCEDAEYRARALEFKHQLGKIGDRMDKLNKELDILDMSDEDFQEYVKNHPEEFEGV